MADFLSPSDILGTNNNLKFIDHKKINEDNREFLRNDLWALKFNIAPAAVYFPGDDFISLRLVSVNPSIEDGITEVAHVIRGFNIRQKVSINTSGSITLNFVDREDQGIHAFTEDWKDKIMSKNERFSFRKEDTVAELEYTLFNSSRQAIRRYTFFVCQPNTGGGHKIDGDSAAEASSNSELALTLDFEHYSVEYLNLN